MHTRTHQPESACCQWSCVRHTVSIQTPITSDSKPTRRVLMHPILAWYGGRTSATQLATSSQRRASLFTFQDGIGASRLQTNWSCSNLQIQEVAYKLWGKFHHTNLTIGSTEFLQSIVLCATNRNIMKPPNQWNQRPWTQSNSHGINGTNSQWNQLPWAIQSMIEHEVLRDMSRVSTTGTTLARCEAQSYLASTTGMAWTSCLGVYWIIFGICLIWALGGRV